MRFLSSRYFQDKGESEEREAIIFPELDELRQIYYHYLHSTLKSHSFLPVGCNTILMKKNNLDFKITIKKNREPFELFAFLLSILMFVFVFCFLFVCFYKRP